MSGRHPQADTPWPDIPPLGQTHPSPGQMTPPTPGRNPPPSADPLDLSPPAQDTPPPSACWDTHPLPSACWDTTPPPGGHCSRWYTSYWNAFLLLDNYCPQTKLREGKVMFSQMFVILFRRRGSHVTLPMMHWDVGTLP